MFNHWNLPLVALSFTVAMLASFTALELTRQVRHAARPSMRRVWLGCGSCAMGLGIWSMHFVGMMAWRPAMAMSLEPGLTLLSLLMAIASSALALRLAGSQRLSRYALIPGGLVMGLGIALMHYTGMAAMQMGSMRWHYSPSLVLLSVSVAVVAATVALLLFRFHGENSQRSDRTWRLLSAAFMGLAISGMHYTGMSAMVMETRLTPNDRIPRADTFWLAVAVAAASLMILAFTLIQLLTNGRLSAQIRMGRELQHLLDNTHRTLDFERLQGRIMLNAIDDGVFTVDQQGLVQHANPTALELIGILEKDVKGRPFGETCRLQKTTSGQPLADPLVPVLERGEVVHLHSQVRLYSLDGKEHTVELKASPLRSRGHSIIGAVVIVRDVSFRQEMMQRLERQALRDSLTGLYNRRAFDQEMLNYEQNRAQDGHYLCIFDLDNFKLINDSCGHAAGDDILHDFARLLDASFGNYAFLARLGGDEFAAIVHGQPWEQVLSAAEHLRREIESYSYEHDRKLYAIGTSIGLAAMDERFKSVSDIMIAADRACYSAKCGGRNQLRIYREDDDQALQRDHEVRWLPKLREALRENRFVLYTQRIDSVLPVEGKGGRYHEILLRYEDDEGQHISPGVFLPVAERSHLMPEIDRWVIHHAFSLLSQQRDVLEEGDRFAINLSGQSLSDEHFVDYVLEQFQKWQVPAGMICFEITETVAISGFDRAQRFMMILRRHGFEFSLDDFGSGMSSFAYLAALPIQHIKIDGSFVKDLSNSEVNRAIVNSISGIGRSLGLKTIAEFVENGEILAGLRELGVDYAQGYGIERPEGIMRLFDIKHSSALVEARPGDRAAPGQSIIDAPLRQDERPPWEAVRAKKV